MFGFAYANVIVFITRSETANVGHIDSTYELLEVEFVEKEQGSLIYANHLEVGDNKHTLTYTYDVHLVSYASIESQPLTVSTNNTKVSIVSYTSIMVNQTPQAVDVQVALSEESTYVEGEELNFNLAFNLSGSSIPENYTPPVEEPEEIVYDMIYTVGNNQTFNDEDLDFYSVNVFEDYVELKDNQDSRIEITLNKGELQINFGESGTIQNIEIFLNNSSIGEFRASGETQETITIAQDNVQVKIQDKEYASGVNINEITYRPD